MESNSYAELVKEVLNRAQYRQTSVYSKFRSTLDYQVFYTKYGVQKRNHNLKFKALQNKNEVKDKAAATVDKAVEKYLNMLKVHN